jgi:hypothetical protein
MIEDEQKKEALKKAIAEERFLFISFLPKSIIYLLLIIYIFKGRRLKSISKPFVIILNTQRNRTELLPKRPSSDSKTLPLRSGT